MCWEGKGWQPGRGDTGAHPGFFPPSDLTVGQIIPAVGKAYFIILMFVKCFKYLFHTFFFKLDLGQAFFHTHASPREGGLGIQVLGFGVTMEKRIHATLYLLKISRMKSMTHQ